MTLQEWSWRTHISTRMPVIIKNSEIWEYLFNKTGTDDIYWFMLSAHSFAHSSHLMSCWREPPRKCDISGTVSWAVGGPCLRPGAWPVCSTCHPCSQKLPQRYSLEIEMWCWGLLDWVHDWTQLRPLHKLLRCRWEGVEILLSLSPSKTILLYKYPGLVNLTPTKVE